MISPYNQYRPAPSNQKKKTFGQQLTNNVVKNISNVQIPTPTVQPVEVPSAFSTPAQGLNLDYREYDNLQPIGSNFNPIDTNYSPIGTDYGYESIPVDIYDQSPLNAINNAPQNIFDGVQDSIQGFGDSVGKAFGAIFNPNDPDHVKWMGGTEILKDGTRVQHMGVVPQLAQLGSGLMNFSMQRKGMKMLDKQMAMQAKAFNQNYAMTKERYEADKAANAAALGSL